ncbi:hypothetical protein HanRHA438_Chr17g0841721 [Helianthus annuus]|nr:hypothetical protein HanRHA438_Chr17g0841721 [Helianthus annuus]
MASNGFHLMLTFLAFSHLLFMANAISTSGMIHRHLLHEKLEILGSGDTKYQVHNACDHLLSYKDWIFLGFS